MVLAPSGKVTQLYALCRHRCVQYCQCDLRIISILPLSPLRGCFFYLVEIWTRVQIYANSTKTSMATCLSRKTVSKVLIQYNKYKVSLIVHSVVDKLKEMFFDIAEAELDVQALGRHDQLTFTCRLNSATRSMKQIYLK